MASLSADDFSVRLFHELEAVEADWRAVAAVSPMSAFQGFEVMQLLDTGTIGPADIDGLMAALARALPGDYLYVNKIPDAIAGAVFARSLAGRFYAAFWWLKTRAQAV